MRIRNVICVTLLGGLCAFAQQGTDSSQKPSTAQSDSKAAAQQQKKPMSPAAANPFPEAQSQKAEDAASGAGTPASQGYSSSHVDLNRFAPDASRLTRLSNGHGGYIHDPQLAATDDKVGEFYLQTGDYKGAYDRFRESTLVAPEDANAVYGLAQAARELGWDKDAITNYSIYVDAVPHGKHSKDARKALKELEAKQKK